MGRKAKDLTGQILQNYTVLYRVYGDHNHKSSFWMCRCKCGHEVVRAASYLKGRMRNSRSIGEGCKKCTNPEIEGRRYGNRVVLKFDKETRIGRVLCDCGNEHEAPYNSFKNNKSCGRCSTFKRIGQKFNKITVLGVSPNKYGKTAIYICKCDCGTVKEIPANFVIYEKVKSCGCHRKERMSGVQSPNSKFSENDVKAIRELSSSKIYSDEEIAKIYDVDPRMIKHIVTGERFTS